MNKIIKKSACMLLATTLSVATYLTASAVATSSKNNAGNKVKYGKTIDLSLNNYTHTISIARYSYNDKKFKSKHKVKVIDDEASVTPYNTLTSFNLVYWYAEWKEDDGKGKIKDSYQEWMTLENNEYYSRELSDDMKFWTWDRDITYCRYDIYPLRFLECYNSEGKYKKKYGSSIDKEEFNAFKSKCRRRASTDITH